MATPRKAWHRTADSIVHESWPRDVVATFTLLSALMHERWRTNALTTEEACSIQLTPGDLVSITGRYRVDKQLITIRKLADHVSITIRKVGVNVLLTWPKWSEFQGLESDPRAIQGLRTAPTAPSPSPSPSPSPEEREQGPLSPSGGRVKSKGKGNPAGEGGEQTGPPSDLTDADLERLRGLVLEDLGERWFEAQIGATVAKMLTHARAKGLRSADWLAEAELWVRREIEFYKHPDREATRKRITRESERPAREAFRAERERRAEERRAAMTPERERRLDELTSAIVFGKPAQETH